MDRYEKLDYAERWMRDALSVMGVPGFITSVEIDMSRSKEVIASYRTREIRITFTHIFARVLALAIERNPELHQIVGHRKKLIPDTVDIMIPVSDEFFLAPVMLIKNAAKKKLTEIAAEIVEKTPQAGESHAKMLACVRRWGKFVPIRWLRRFALRIMIHNVNYRRKKEGTCMLSCLPGVDQFAPLLFTTTLAIGVGQVRDRVIAVDGEPQVRPTVVLSCCADHKVVNAVPVVRLFDTIRDLLSASDLETVL